MRDKRMDGRATAPHELLLIRIGHHLWRSMKRTEWPEKGMLSALETVWAAKEAVRVPLRKEWLEFRQNQKKRLLGMGLHAKRQG